MKAKKKASIKMGAFLFVGSWRRRELNVSPSYDGQSLMSKDSVAKRRSVCQGQSSCTHKKADVHKTL